MADEQPASQAAPTAASRIAAAFTNHAKVSGAVMANAALMLGVAVAHRYGITLTPDEVGPASILVTGIVGYLVPGGDS